MDSSSLPFLHRHEFMIRRLHSLSGLIPVGAFMCVHLLVNASVNNGAATFQDAVYQIHSLGRLLPIVEWVFIFIPILFHAIVGVVIVAGGLPNNSSYPYRKNFPLYAAAGYGHDCVRFHHVARIPHAWLVSF